MISFWDQHTKELQLRWNPETIQSNQNETAERTNDEIQSLPQSW